MDVRLCRPRRSIHERKYASSVDLGSPGSHTPRAWLIGRSGDKEELGLQPSPLNTYLGLYAHVARLAVRAVAHRAHYLLVAPAVAVALGFLSRMVTNIAAGFVYSLIQAAALSLVLFVARAIIEQRRLGAEDLQSGFGVFLNDILTVLFTFWIASMVLGSVGVPAGVLLFGVAVLFPLFETTALSDASSFAISSRVRLIARAIPLQEAKEEES